jgi:hypothetical protein
MSDFKDKNEDKLLRTSTVQPVADTHLRAVAIVLETLCEANKPPPQVGHLAALGTPVEQPTEFDGIEPPSDITLFEFLQRTAVFSECSKSSMTYAVIYIDRVLSCCKGFKVKYSNVHRLFLTCLMIAAKFLDDRYASNSLWAKIGGIPLQEMNYLEVELLHRIGFQIIVSEETFNQYSDLLSKMKEPL